MDSLTTLNTFAATSVTYTDEAAGAATLTNRYQINGVIDTTLPVMENLEKICSAAGSWLSYDVSTGKWGVVINRTGSSVASFNNSNILGPISVSGTGLKDLYNAVRVEFPNRDLRDASDFVKIELPAGEKNSNELPNTLNLAYDNINEPVQAQLLGFIELKQSRVDLIITFETDYSHINLQAGDLISVTNTQFSFNAKIFRIITIAEKQGDSALTLEITALEYDTTVYSTADLSRFVRSDSTGIITIGSIGTPGTPVVTKFESDVRPRIVVTSTAPTGIVEAMEFWRTTDVALAESARSYQQIGTQRPAGGGTYSSGTTVTFELDTLNSSNFFIKTRGINDLTVGQFSTPSGLVEYVPEQVTDAIDPDTKITDALGAITTAQTLFTLLGLVDDLLAGVSGKSIWTRIKELFQEATGIDINTAGAVQSASAITVRDEGVTRTAQLTSLNFVGAGVTATNASGAITVTIPGGGAGGSGLNILNNPSAGDYLVYNGTGYVAVPNCVCPVDLGIYDPNYVAPAEPCILNIITRYPPDRSTGADPITGFQSDLAPITGSYFLVFGAGSAGTFHGPVSAGSGNARLYKSNGTLVETLSAAQLTYDKNTVGFPFATRTLKTDYYILMDAGMVVYCNCTSPAITAATGSGAWNFNTPPYSTTAYTVAGSNFTAPNATVPTVTSHTPSGVSQCPNAALSLTFNVAVTKLSGSIRTKKFSDDTLVQTFSVSTATLTGNTLNFGVIDSTLYTANTQYYIEADANIVESNNGDCFQKAPNAVVNKASNKTFTTLPVLAVTSFAVSSLPVASDPSRQKVNPQTLINITFNRAIFLHSSGTITLNSSAGVHQIFDVADTFALDAVSELISTSGSTIILNPTEDLALNTDYHVLFSAGCVKDSCDTVFGGLSNPATVAWKTDAGPIMNTTFTDSGNELLRTGLVFDRTIVPSTGLLSVVDVSTGTTIASFASTNAAVTITEI